MKAILIFILSICTTVIGLIAYVVYFKYNINYDWMFLIIATFFMGVPAHNSWFKYFKKTFKKS